MVYIAGDGSIQQSPPWSLKTITNFFHGIIYFVIYFFQTLVGLDTSSAKSYGGFRSGGSSSSKGSGGGGGGGSGGGPWRPGGGGGGGGPSRRIMTMKDISPPTVGGCPGGACGL